jgi:hypothetical protein
LKQQFLLKGIKGYSTKVKAYTDLNKNNLEKLKPYFCHGFYGR